MPWDGEDDISYVLFKHRSVSILSVLLNWLIMSSDCCLYFINWKDFIKLVFELYLINYRYFIELFNYY